ncbi:TetR/AcrR family transcriptional regulator [Actinomadura rudentiformis]|uniref:TetR/AcrR family transcriptional regulator n=1 Tax=Actinomadura rudentiformis TaxID=359158 RepID=A0A6H9YHD9_9ACTN|nr:TetR/AcrR family transcriptional regulator [Actinomadura rudentiformis]KAB2339961.1 TetR/AcrR family transcriptional regulator [Actinomadura rudentiformis]
MPTRPRPYHHGDLRAALLTRAEETLREKGPTALSLRELARDLGVSHAAPSRHFKDKQALLDALALAGFERLGEIMAASQEGIGESFAERLDAMVRAYVGFATANAALLDLMYSVKHDPEASEALSASVQRWSAQTVELIAEGQRRGEVREGPVERIGLPVFTTLHGYADLATSGMLPPEATEHGLDDVIAYILRGSAPD